MVLVEHTVPCFQLGPHSCNDSAQSLVILFLAPTLLLSYRHGIVDFSFICEIFSQSSAYGRFVMRIDPPHRGRRILIEVIATRKIDRIL